MRFKPVLVLLIVAQLALAALADQLVDNVTEAENQARAVLGTVLEAPRNPGASVEQADAARESLKMLITSLVKFKEALLRADGSDSSAYQTVRTRDLDWRSQREALQYTETEREFLGRMDNMMQAVDQDVADR